MSIFDYFRSKSKASSASVAKERLQIIVAHERGQRQQPDYLPQMQQEILDVIRKYVAIDQESINIQLENNDHCSVLELNVTLPDR
ncbi:cell division topological specificity factor MinE [Marinobacterium rhizophilum]|uniref:Cell division topological specificity factor n=1 Tax=Marinobacterium rhizophilum TaxID=420402 RepID=A0ABY5HNI9_9GAMM|nr:cell division topological specificity factor MinE [Marinobacterium rhizophilum]UTW13436.1 cell division topological specificity factor MinE [Marinobacterium rhizophilum]